MQRLILETSPVLEFASRASAGFEDGRSGVEVLLETRIDALDITVLKSGGAAVSEWAAEHGFELSEDAPDVLEFYADRSPIFLAAVFDGDAAAERGQLVGDGTPVHITIPTSNPWVPLRILGMGKPDAEIVQADVFLLTDYEPALLPEIRQASTRSGGRMVEHSAAASKSLLADLRSDEGMDWVPDSGWLTKIRIDDEAGDLTFDLAVDASGGGNPSRAASGLAPISLVNEATVILLPLLGLLVAGGSVMGSKRRRRDDADEA